ncbi:MAG: hypothetical protein A6F71_00200 [Cycloclasticus sp. symbiont of Poecilosclerida sp. M]|nr:MAG: hypothetical protein A6F71_00200 [Cycloclasticus sp. symbiont of Poecilosclerida sp. M]
MLDLAEKASIEMGFTRLEFNNLLLAQDVFEFTTNGNRVVFLYMDGEVKMRLGDDDYRCISSWKIPKIKIDLDFSGLEESSRRPFMNTFTKTFLKGGG